MKEPEINKSFNEWFRIMWENTYIQLFIVGFILLILEIIYFPTLIGYLMVPILDRDIAAIILCSLGLLIPPAVCFFIAYLGFYKFWKQLTGGKNV